MWTDYLLPFQPLIKCPIHLIHLVLCVNMEIYPLTLGEFCQLVPGDLHISMLQKIPGYLGTKHL